MALDGGYSKEQTVARSGFSLVWRRRNQLLTGPNRPKILDMIKVSTSIQKIPRKLNDFPKKNRIV